MKQQEWYAGRRKIVEAQRTLGNIIAKMEQGLRETHFDNDPVTNRSPIAVVEGEQIVNDGSKAFAVQSVTRGNVTFVLEPASTVIQVVPPIAVRGVGQVSAITGSIVDPGTSQTLLTVVLATGPDRDEKQVGIEDFYEAIEDAVLVEEPQRRWSPASQ